VLFQLGNFDKAARDAELAVRYAPDLPNAHNLLLKIYRNQGRLDEAARQAAWLDSFEAKKTRVHSQ
jgi:Flp pilus assembly protein TadD